MTLASTRAEVANVHGKNKLVPGTIVKYATMGEPVHLIHKYSVDEAKVAAVKKRVTGGTELMYCSGVERIAIDDSGPRRMVSCRTQLVTSLAGWSPGVVRTNGH